MPGPGRTRINLRGSYIVVDGAVADVWRELHDPESARWLKTGGGVRSSWMRYPEGAVNVSLVESLSVVVHPDHDDEANPQREHKTRMTVLRRGSGAG